eukprot:sb/3464395/
MPAEQKDYYHEIVVATEREKFLIPVHCMGSRAVLDLPDNIEFGIQPVKHKTTKTLLVRNIGSREARFSFKTEEPYSVAPSHGSLGVGGSMQVHVTFDPLVTGTHINDMVLQYDTGENIAIELSGNATDANIRLEKNQIKMESTYITLSTQKTFTIHNRSNIVVRYEWKKYASRSKEEEIKKSCFQDLESDEESDLDKFMKQCISDPTKRHELSLVSQTYQNKKMAVEDDLLLFEDDNITLEPISGEIWPNSSTEITVMFKPDKMDQYVRRVYCDITGRESRLPLKITGYGIGPKANFSCDSIDIGNIFIGSKHSYEVLLENRGEIPIDFSLISPDTVFGKLFSFFPDSGHIPVGDLQLIKIVFQSNILGTFSEEFKFKIEGAKDINKIRMHGTVIGPTFHFNTECVKFGVVSYGFVHSQIVTISNTSDIAMRYKLRIPDDTNARHIPGEKRQYCGGAEFEVSPDEGVLSP